MKDISVMIHYIWILLLFGSSYVCIDFELSLPTVTTTVISKTITTTTKIKFSKTEPFNDNATGNFRINRNSRDTRDPRESRLLEGETMGGLTGCESFEVGDKVKMEFYSPNYPNEYPSKITCTRVLTANAKDERVIVDFRDRFDLEPSENCKYDRLEVRDGAHGYSAIRGRFCGHQFPEQIISTGSDLWLRFTSDENIEYRGFRAVYWFEKRNISEAELNDEPCVINKTEVEGNFNLSVSDIPEEQRKKGNKNGIDCMFNIYVEKDKMVSLSWDQFNLQYPNNCDLNYVNILEENSDTIKHVFCGAAAEPIQFNSNKVQIQYVVRKSAINSSFSAHFTPFRKSTNCTSEEFDCQDGNCIDLSLQCNGVNNCVTALDEDTEDCFLKKEESFWKQLTKADLLIILIVFFLILFGMCFTLIFNIVRKLIHDFSVIKEHVNQSRESQLDQIGRKTPTATLLTPMVTILPNLPHNLINATEKRRSIHIRDSLKEEEEEEEEEENDCYVPTEHTFPNLIRKEYGFDRINGGPQYHQNICQSHRESSRDYNDDEEEDGLVTKSGDSVSYMPEMRDNECQTRESLFFSTCPSTTNKNMSVSPSPPQSAAIKPGSDIKPVHALPPMNTPPIGFTTFGYKNNQKPDIPVKNSKGHRFRAEAVIEMERLKSPKHDSPSTDSRQSRPYSIQSTKSAPDVIVTH